MLLRPGQIIRFTYTHHVRDKNTGNPNKEVLVLHPSWEGKIHGIDLGRLSPAEREVLEAIMDPQTRESAQKHRIPMVNDIIKRMDPTREIRDPKTFYARFVKLFLKNKDAYRQYYPSQMSNVQLQKDVKISTGKKPNPNPLFGDKPQTPQQVSAAERLAALRNRTPVKTPPPPSTPVGPTPMSQGVVGQGVVGQQSAAARLAALRAKAGIKK